MDFLASDDFREDAEKHWAFIEKMLLTLESKFNVDHLKFLHFMYVEAMVHGYKHAKADSLQLTGEGKK